jgi:hypothetical protein
MPEMIFVDSSNIEAIGYESSTMELHVRFSKSGKTYVYYSVEEHVHSEFMQSDSKGSFLNSRIKHNYQFAEL